MHLDATYRILMHLKSALGNGILFSNHGHLRMEASTDRWSTSDYCTFLTGNLVTWRSKKQTVVARSNAKVEYRAMAHGICVSLYDFKCY